MAILPSFSIKDVLELLKKGAQVEAEEKIMELRRGALDLQDDNARLREQLAEAQHKLELRDLKFERAAYWKDGDGPYCQRCADVDTKLVRLHDQEGSVGKYWHCHACKENFYYEKTQVPDHQPRRRGGGWMGN